MAYGLPREGQNSTPLPARTDFGMDPVSTSVTFAGGTANGIGDFNGTGNPHTLFTVTGVVLVRMLAVCTTTVTIDATATLSCGTVATVGGLQAVTAGDAIDVNEIWHDASPDSSVELVTVLTEKIVSDDIIATTATANILTGVIEFTALWYPVTADGNLT